MITKVYLYLHGAQFLNVKSWGLPYVYVSLKGTLKIGTDFKMNNWIGRSQSGYKGICRIEVHKGGELKIGNNVGMSSTTITCFKEIVIGDNVRIGVGTHIFDSDFHAIDPSLRLNFETDFQNKKCAPIKIGENVLIGANSHILKGVSIGRNSIVGAASVVTKDIPENEIWGGNPAKFLKKIIS